MGVEHVFKSNIQPGIDPHVDVHKGQVVFNGELPKDIVIQHERKGKKTVKPKTSRMLEVEAEYNNLPIETLLGQLYSDQQKSTYKVSSEIGLPPGTVKNWMNKLSIPKRTRQEAIELKWSQDKDELTAKIHTPGSDSKRSKTQKDSYKKNPELLKQFNKMKQEVVEKRRSQAFGDDIYTALLTMHDVEGLTLDEIVAKTGYSRAKIEDFMNIAGVEKIPQTNADAVKKFQQVQVLLWSNPSSLQSLTRIEKEVIDRRFIGEDRMHSLSEVGKELDISRQRVTKIENNAIEKLAKGQRAQ